MKWRDMWESNLLLHISMLLIHARRMFLLHISPVKPLLYTSYIMAAALISACANTVQTEEPRVLQIEYKSLTPPEKPSPKRYIINPNRPASAIKGELIILQSWATAENNQICVPIGSLAGNTDLVPTAVISSRPSTQVGWAIVFNHPNGELGYSIESVGNYAPDEESEAVRRTTVQKEWPAFRELPNLAPGAYVGYRALGESLYSPKNPEGIGMATKASVHIPGQKCTYDISDRISRMHLEKMLDGLRMIDISEYRPEPA